MYKNKQFPTSLSSSSDDVKEPFLIKLEKEKKTYNTMCAKNVTYSVTVHTCTRTHTMLSTV